MSVVSKALEKIQTSKPNFKPTVAVILGFGLGQLADVLTDATEIAYADIPGFQTCTVAGHAGSLILGYIGKTAVVCLKGRPHYYEGAENTAFQTLIYTLKQLGCASLIATNAAGSLHESVQPGEVVLITDHINFHQRNPLIGPNDDNFGPRFIALDDLYNTKLRQHFKTVAAEQKITLHEGVYVCVFGPTFETPAEIRAFKLLGGDVVGMSTVPEVIVAHHCGMKVAVISAITNLAAGLSQETLSHEQTLRGAALASDKLFTLITESVRNLPHA